MKKRKLQQCGIQHRTSNREPGRESSAIEYLVTSHALRNERMIHGGRNWRQNRPTKQRHACCAMDTLQPHRPVGPSSPSPTRDRRLEDFPGVSNLTASIAPDFVAANCFQSSYNKGVLTIYFLSSHVETTAEPPNEVGQNFLARVLFH